jgi:aminoglycoside 6'-N-acetyltransferase
MAEPYRFTPVTMADLPLLEGWRQLPHVIQWWDDEPLFEAEDLANPRVVMWRVDVQGQPFAYLQDYAIHGWPDHHFAHLPAGARGLDQFIGPPAMLGCGHGQALIAQRAAALFAVGVPELSVDPHPANARAIHVYARIGFQISGPPAGSPWGEYLPMVLQPPA